MKGKLLKCPVCGKELSCNRYGNICQSCYIYFKNGGVIHPLPPYGEIVCDDKGYIICHLCGKAYPKLGSHVMQSHGMAARQYRMRFGLDVRRGICSRELRETLAAHVEENYEVVVGKNLIKNGYPTRFQPGCTGRTKDKISEQTMRKLKKSKIVKSK